MQKFLDKLPEVLENSISKCKAKTIALSGGLDSSVLAYFLKNKDCNAVAVTTKDFIATDLTYCQLVAKKFNLPLKIIMPKTEELLSSINETIKILKNFNDIEIRNSIVIYIVLKSVKDSGESKIILGDGADELFAGYSFFLKKNKNELQKDLERIWDVMHFPSKKIGKSLGITVETPFLDDNVMNLAKIIPVNFKVSEHNGKKYGKWILRKAFEDKLPKSVVWREKSPMQDGAGTGALTHLFDTVISDELFESKIRQIKELDNVKLRTKESLHYYEVYRKYFEPPEKLHDSKN
ncbi:MAG TPA: asparagine synthase-related protein, partial [Nitrosopumilaceae archaeon]|nr:asparagine synthase-related protein [Nitrosopumilaceae archaeon]